ncbi:MAG: hypothetical protein AMXMBFR55_28130 [Gemmatimonadota bacterium]
MSRYPLTDLALSRRLERAEACANAAFVEARAALSPAVGAGWRDVGGAYVMFDGIGSPLTQSFGVALFAPASPDQLQGIEEYLGARGAEVVHEVGPIADPAILPILAARGYRPVELTSVLCRVLDPAQPSPDSGTPGLVARRIAPDETATWVETAAAGWGETPELAEFMRDFGGVTVRASRTHAFIAERDGVPIAAGAMHINEGVALLAGASTVPAGRRQGAQAALLAARLRYAADCGCDLAMMCAAPGSGSQRNAERRGFRMAYTRIKWGRGDALTREA